MGKGRSSKSNILFKGLQFSYITSATSYRIFFSISPFTYITWIHFSCYRVWRSYIFSVIEFADLSGVLFHDQISIFSEKISIHSVAIFHSQLICSVQVWRKCHADKHSQCSTAVWYHQDSSMILEKHTTDRIITSWVLDIEVETART